MVRRNVVKSIYADRRPYHRVAQKKSGIYFWEHSLCKIMHQMVSAFTVAKRESSSVAKLIFVSINLYDVIRTNILKVKLWIDDIAKI